MKITYHFILIFYLCVIPYISTQELRFVFEMLRHGARAPTDNLDENSEDWFGFKWSGVKELTNVGLRQSYLTGYSDYLRYIRDKKFLSETFDPREVYLISTDSHRTLLTANAHLQGLYPHGTGPELSDGQRTLAVPPNDLTSCSEEIQNVDALPFKMNILPIHSFFSADRYIQLQDKKVCPGVTGYYEKTQDKEAMLTLLEEIENKYGDNFNTVAKNFKKDMFLEYATAYSILDAVICADVDGRNFSKFENNGINRKELVDDAYRFFRTDFEIIQESRNKVGEMAMSPVFTQIKKWMDRKIEYDKNGNTDYKGFDMPKYVMYSAHDSTMAVFNYFLELNFGVELTYPTFASRINFELIKNPNGTYEIHYYFNEELKKTIPYEDFKNKLNKVLKTKEEIAAFCRFDSGENLDYYSLFTIILIAIAISLIIGIIHIFYKRRNSQHSMKHALNSIEDDSELEV